MYDYREGVPQDYAEAVRWLRLAAEQGDAAGQCLLGTMYRHGKGVPQDDTEAARWLRLAAQQGDRSAQYFLDLMSDEGKGASRWLGIAVTIAIGGVLIMIIIAQL